MSGPEEDDNYMHRFERHGLSSFSARLSIASVALTLSLLVLLSGSSVVHAGQQMHPGVERDVVLAVGRPTSWIATRLPLQRAAHDATRVFAADAVATNGPGGFAAAAGGTNANGNGNGNGAGASAGSTAGVMQPVTADAFDPAELGIAGPKPVQLHTLLVTGDSMSMPLDLVLARALAGKGVKVVRDPHVGTGISQTDLLDWGQEATRQVAQDKPDAVVVFLGANEGYPISGTACCSAQWAALYATRARQMMDTYRRAGAARVYWLNLPTPRDPRRYAISRVVNAAVRVASEPWRSQVHVIDVSGAVTPGDRYRDSMSIAGHDQIVREPDGIHLNETGSTVAAKLVLDELGHDFLHVS